MYSIQIGDLYCDIFDLIFPRNWCNHKSNSTFPKITVKATPIQTIVSQYSINIYGIL